MEKSFATYWSSFKITLLSSQIKTVHFHNPVISIWIGASGIQKAIFEGAKQIWGAARWIKKFPHRIYLDRPCKQPFPFNLPNAEDASIHRIVVAHGASDRCRQELGGSGSLLIDPNIIGADHILPRSEGGFPFAVGYIKQSKGFVHILDDTSLSIVMNTRDTITDFVEYLSAKEQFIASGMLGMAVGEEELLGYYLKDVNSEGKHYFKAQKEDGALIFDEGHWEYFTNSPERQAQIAANEISYAWDRLIETFSKNVIGGTLYHTTHPNFSDQDRLLRFLARESRTRRRMLAEVLIGLIVNTPRGEPAARIVASMEPGDPHYCFVVFPPRSDKTHSEYREVRSKVLRAYCMVTKVMRPEAEYIVGIATEPGVNDGSSEDLLCLDARNWTAEDQAEALSLQRELNIFENPIIYHKRVEEYPLSAPLVVDVTAHKEVKLDKNPRNKPCLCGSGKKYKRCCSK